MDKQKALYLIMQYRSGALSAEELDELQEWLKQHPDGLLIQEAIEEDLHRSAKEEGLSQELLDKMFQKVIGIDKVGVQPAPVRRMPVYRMVAAASIVLMVLVGIWWFNSRSKKQADVATTTERKNDLAPGRTKAVLTLADGRTIVLDSSTGHVADQNGVTVINLNGQLKYEGKASEVAYNTVQTPKGGQYQLVLADGSKVWLNAASSLRFPTAFTGKERRVELTGEGYFEVAHNASKPFIVGIPPLGGKEGGWGEGMQVQVLGTHFNINAYNDEPIVKTTLLEGKVKVSSNKEAVTIKPGEQARLSNPVNPLIPKIQVQTVDLDEVMAWKNGYFSFTNADIQTVMRQLSRWYDVDVVYQGAIPDEKLEGKIPRNVNASTVLAALQYTGIQFKIEGKKLYVMP